MSSPKPEFHVPGAYHFDNPPHFLAHLPPLGANVFLPPSSPSVSSSAVLNLAKSTNSLYSDISTAATAANTKRKRAAHDSRESTPLAADWGSMSVETSYGGQDSVLGELGDPSGKRIVYTLAGQIDTAGAAPAASSMEDSVYSDVDYRRALGPKQDFSTAGTDALDGETLHGSQPPSSEERWTVLHALGNVVGKVWEFCTMGAFRGFHAGGGTGYDWETGKPTIDEQRAEKAGERANERESERSVPEHDTPNRMPEKRDGEFRIGFLGGGFATERNMEDVKQRQFTDASSPIRRNGKRRQVGTVGDELGRNWVMVQPDQGLWEKQFSPATAASPRTLRQPSPAVSVARAPISRKTSGTKAGRPDMGSRRISRPVSRLSGGSTPVQNSRLRVSHAGSPGLSPREPASFAPSRSPAIAGTARATFGDSPSYGGPTASRIPVPQAANSGSANPFARVASPRPSSRAGTRHSAALPMSSPSAHRRSNSSTSALGAKAGGGVIKPSSQNQAGYDAVEASPRLNDEAKRLAAQNRAAEQDADAKMEAFNMRLEEMIRQGQEALGTRFEVDVDGDDDQEEQVGFWMDDE